MRLRCSGVSVNLPQDSDHNYSINQHLPLLSSYGEIFVVAVVFRLRFSEFPS